ncbi:Sporulation-specific cell division protein SsgB [Streptomyces sp. RB5]|uniref:Sporulation-specific cell division protein SsgB n=1 Tax=Streptomyces smaragdinus TaxID=2585196 RepID=A0A7K0C9B2_9ACTN|nr:SsgA family sporulation/cell division regulator [Streptomyces smaragdinus]MQY10039.1 Sporulation-specific cell division protein SsgB [Streptomyces smaragdinus]
MPDVYAWRPVMAHFRYDPVTPLIVTVEFVVEDGPCVVWRIGRDLLYQGLFSLSGLEDVQVWPTDLERRETAFLQLTSRSTAALFELRILPLERWLERTYQVVPAGTETDGLGWEAFVAEVLDVAPDCRRGEPGRA